MKNKSKTISAGTIAMLCILSFIGMPVKTSAELSSDPAVSASVKQISYREYNKTVLSVPVGADDITINASEFLENGKIEQKPEYEGQKNVLILKETSGEVTYRFHVASAGRYRIGALYFPVAGSGSLDINLSFKIDGKNLFEESESVYLSKIYVNESAVTRDKNGNDLRPRQIEKPEWMESWFVDNSGYNPDPFEIGLTAGEHTITLELTQQSIALQKLRISGNIPLATYDEVKQQYSAKGFTEADGEIQLYEAEQASKKSGSSLYPDNDRANANTTPSDPNKLRLNVISSSDPGDWMTWNIKAAKSGLYRIGFRVHQNSRRGMASTRRLYIDGKVPFEEANNLEFPYSAKWYDFVAGGEDPWLFYLEAGVEHTITLECTTGRFAETLSVVQGAVYDLNEICRRITMVTGISPDIYRDYDFAAEIPDLNERLVKVKNVLQSEVARLDQDGKYEGSELVTVKDLVRQLDSFIQNPRGIPSRLSNFYTNISILGTWLLEMTKQEITMDSISLLPKDAQMPDAGPGFFKQMVYDIKSVAGSFFNDYQSISSEDGKEARKISVWVTMGRDQANIIRRMIDNDFSSQTGTSVDLSLVNDSTTLMQAAFSGNGPDVAMFVDKTLPVNLAARGALCELSGFDGYQEVISRFFPSAMIPYQFQNGSYAIPNSQGFNVMFIRTDIFQELGITIPQTWDEFYKIIPVIQRNNMQIGAGVNSQTIFETLILQQNGQFYKKDMSATDFDSKEVLNAFKMWTGFYSDYGLALTYDVFTYFRSGIMPVAIADYTQYNQFAVAAPEIKGLWTISPIPGMRQKDGKIKRTESSTGTASMIMNSAKEKQKSFDFLNWWSRTDTQTEYSLELESVMGPAARYNSANYKALGGLAWKTEEYNTIMSQWEDVWDIPTIPSSYYVARNVSNAFRNVVYNNKNERETLNRYSEIINKEITRKNKELGIR